MIISYKTLNLSATCPSIPLSLKIFFTFPSNTPNSRQLTTRNCAARHPKKNKSKIEKRRPGQWQQSSSRSRNWNPTGLSKLLLFKKKKKTTILINMNLFNILLELFTLDLEFLFKLLDQIIYTLIEKGSHAQSNACVDCSSPNLCC